MAAYAQIVSTRTTFPDLTALVTQLRTALSDVTIGISIPTDPTIYRVKHSSDVAFTVGELTTIQTTIDNAPAITPQRQAQNEADNLTIIQKAMFLTLLDAINTVRAALPVPLGAITVNQAITAVRNKAGTL